MRWIAVLLVLAGVAAAQGEAEPKKKKPELFPEGAFRNAAPGARERVYERHFMMLARTTKDAADVEAFEALVELAQTMNRSEEWIKPVRDAVATKGLSEKRQGALRGLLGYLLCEKAGSFTGGNFIIIVNGRVLRQGNEEVPREAIALYTEAEGHLREAIRTHPTDTRSRHALADAVEALYKEERKDEVKRLRTQADAILTMNEPTASEARAARHDNAARALRDKAEALEQKAVNPAHGEALTLRKQALMLDYAAFTIPFEVDASLYRSVALIAPPAYVTRNLTRTFRNRAGEIDTVPPQYFAPTEDMKVAMVRELAAKKGDAAAATLLALLCRDVHMRGRLQDAALDALTTGRHPGAVAKLPHLLDAALLGPDAAFYSPWARRLLVQLAARLDVAAAAPVLRRALPRDTDLRMPLGIAATLGAVGGPGDADALLLIARDPARDVSFRRDALAALGRLAPDRLDEAPKESYLELAVAAARYAKAPSEDLKGLLLNGLAREHEADDAALFCASLGIREATPLIEDLLAKQPDHYAVATFKRALATLEGRG